MKGEEKELTTEEEEAAIRLLYSYSRRTTHKRKINQQARTGTSKGNAIQIRPLLIKDIQVHFFNSCTSGRYRGHGSRRSAGQIERREEVENIDLAWLPATAVEVERLFSTIKCMLGYLHKRRSAETLETILFLEINLVLVANERTSSKLEKMIFPILKKRDSFGAGHQNIFYNSEQ
ncbi:hypothetical protein GQ600_793 [Phytophthora cactorum]|nr:hypothetical protein GQ600_793 [Phytophthora cactorum]